ncbi:sigma-54 interaction domain-containing protein [candidate division CSSED10-310 bacterium]|uniref:Sigma-54 interaction domain-containing protein n=1 Tax=candidate division CSSED10-310 bacterium TaxID=2855610 RepID=A0ABV6Z0Z5_UNCC1
MKNQLDERFFPLIFDAISHGIFTIDGSQKITSFNHMAEEITGYQRHEVIGQPCSSVFQTDMCRQNCPLKSSISTGERSDVGEVIIITRSGRPLTVEISTAALIDEGGNVIGGVEMFRDLQLVTELRKQLYKSYVYEDIISKNHHMQKIFTLLPAVANTQSTVLVTGESGTGKELIARAIHSLGPRKGGPFVAINCGAIPDNLLESELFGYKQGAFTDAKRDKPGKFAAAEGGTLLLDEIGDISKHMQVKLLRVLQEREYSPLGSTELMKTDVKIIASTNRDLIQDINDGRFRRDLYYRLNVVQIKLPPLSERREDIPLLTQHFIERFNTLQNRRISGCSERVMSAFMNYSFPGNIRELENAIEHAFVICIDNLIQISDLPEQIITSRNRVDQKSAAVILPLENAESQTIRAVLEENDYSRSLSAKQLGISRNTLWRKMKKYGLTDPVRDRAGDS